MGGDKLTAIGLEYEPGGARTFRRVEDVQRILYGIVKAHSHDMNDIDVGR
jgi:hypothetical protein